MTALLFEGQGAQRVGMGRDLFGAFQSLVDRASSIVGFDIPELCLQNPENRLRQTEYTQLAVFTVNHLKLLSLANGTRPRFMLGHSLGELNALLGAGAFDFETGLRLVKERGRLMGLAKDGGMAAVLGLEAPAIEAVIRQEGLDADVFLANYNTQHQTVISGQTAAVARLQRPLKDAGATLVVPLNVSGAFHTRFMDHARQEFAQLLARTSFNTLQTSVISNVTARPYPQAKVGELLSSQVVSSVRWRESIEYALTEGVETFQEIGVGGSLSKMIEHIRSEYKPVARTLPPPRAQQAVERPPIKGLRLGNRSFEEEYNTSSTYVAGGMYKGISSKELVVRMGEAGHLSFFGTGGLTDSEIDAGIAHIRSRLGDRKPYGMNLVCHLMKPEREVEVVNTFLRHGITVVEASAFLRITKSLVLYRLKGLRQGPDGEVIVPHRIIAKVSRPEVAEAFLSPPPEKLALELLGERLISREEMELGREILMANDLCIEADSGGHTDQGNPFALLPAMMSLKKRLAASNPRVAKVRIGAAGGIGTPPAMAAAYLLDADFVVTGSINQATVEAGTSEEVKDLLVGMDIQDTAYAPAGDMFEVGAKVQVLKKGLFFPARANKLYDLYRTHDSLEAIDRKTIEMLETNYFRRSIAEVWQETAAYHSVHNPAEIAKAERIPKHKMALVFRWYFAHTGRLALEGSKQNRVDYQVHCGPALGAFNQWVKGTRFEDWRNRHVDEIAGHLIHETRSYLEEHIARMFGTAARVQREADATRGRVPSAAVDSYGARIAQQ